MAAQANRKAPASEKPLVPGGEFLIVERRPEEVFFPEDFTEQHRLIAHTAAEFMRLEVLPVWERIEHQEPGLTVRLLRQAGTLGLLAIDIPERFGGEEMDTVASTLVTEKIGVYASFVTSFSAHTGIGTLPIVFFGNEEQKKKYLPRLATGELIGAYALSEAEAGSDALAVRTRATLSPDGTHWLLHGEKMWTSNGGIADLFTLFAKVGGEKFTAFLVERGYPGFATGSEERKMGIKGSSTRALILDNVPVPVENVLGEVGRGHIVAFNILNAGRLKLAAACIGASKRALENAVQYARQRRAFGRAIAEFGLIQEKLAEMNTRIYAGESVLYRTAGLIDFALPGVPHNAAGFSTAVRKVLEEYAVECSINKVYASEILDYATDECVQIYGGYGYHQDYPAERAYRDARINRIFEGTNEINRLIITTMLLRRAATDQLALAPASTRLIEEMLFGSLASSPAVEDLPTPTLLAEQKRLVAGVKKASLLVTGIAHSQFGEKLADQQEIVAAISDIIMEAFVMESVVLRTLKMAVRTGEEKATYATQMTRLLVHSRLDWVEQRARAALAAVSQGDTLRGQLAALSRLIRRDPVDVIGLRRLIASRVITQGKYVV